MRYLGAQVVLEGALSGQGVALVRHSLAYKYLKQGLISIVDEYEVKSNFSYYLVAPESYMKREKVKDFREWIVQAANEFWQESQSLMPKTRIHLENEHVY